MVRRGTNFFQCRWYESAPFEMAGNLTRDRVGKAVSANAERCLRLVQNFNDPEAKRSLLAMANAWLALAAQREKTIETAPAHEPTSPLNELPPPLDEPATPPINEPAPASEPPQRLNAAEPDDSIKPDDSLQS
jgi:hypothetical protein